MHRASDGAVRTERAATILRALSALAPDRRRGGFDVSGSGPTAMAWLGALASGAVDGDPFRSSLETEGPLGAAVFVKPDAALDGLSRYDALTPDLLSLRIGWLWVAGTVPIDGVPTRLLLPVLSRAIRIGPGVKLRHLQPVTAWDLWPLVEDPAVAARLEAEASFGGGAIEPGMDPRLVRRLPVLQQWVRKVLAASGLPEAELLAPQDPRGLSSWAAVTGFGVFTDPGADPSRPRETLANWSTFPDLASTALASLYLGSGEAAAPSGPDGPGEVDDDELDGQVIPTPAASPFALTERQARVVLATDRSPITVVSGAPGTGKSQTAVATALHAIAQGRSVLVATQSDTAADVLAELFDRVPGPTPVLFGGGQRSSALADKLVDSVGPVPEGTGRARHEQAVDDVRTLGVAVTTDLDDVAADAHWRDLALTLSVDLDVAPRLLDPSGDASLRDAEGLLERSRSLHGLFAGFRRRRAEQRLRTLLGAPPNASAEALAHAVEVARIRERARRAVRGDRSRTTERWLRFLDAERARRAAAAQAIAEQIASRVDEDARRAVMALATALRAGRAARRAHLRAVDVASLTRALPLWVGTLRDIEHLLPQVAGAFDLVILDEASQIDQVAGSVALLRAKRALVVGDPRQLRFVSFLSDAEQDAALASYGLAALRDRLDVRRVSAFDLAASAAPVRFLDEHFRSVPHLIGFSADRFYDGRLLVATRHPCNDRQRAIEVHHVDGERVAGVNRAEVEAAVDLVRELLATTTGTIGVISPYRPQVDAIQQALGRALDFESIAHGRVRVGTVHGSQGSESDVVVASFGTSDGRRSGFLEDPNLFNVLVTRARKRMIVLASELPARGLLADYVRWGEQLPPAVADAGPVDAWTGRLAGVLADQGLPVRCGYPVGRWSVDLVVGEGEDAIAVATRVHPDGARAHVRRFLALDVAGWRQAEAFPATLDGDVVATALELGGLVRDRRPAPAPRVRG